MVNFKGDWKKKYFFNYVYTVTIQLVIENQVQNLGFFFVDKNSVITEYKSRHILLALVEKWEKIFSVWKETFGGNCLPISPL